ncbi:MAG: hypothetical protein MZV63_64715 [Marinilabiliales bacterium]|nr:hypothetical protein [Marinilabiliales bacterium]
MVGIELERGLVLGDGLPVLVLAEEAVGLAEVVVGGKLGIGDVLAGREREDRPRARLRRTRISGSSCGTS